MNLKAAFEGNRREGVFHLRNGELGYTSAVLNEDGTFGLRYENGWYSNYSNDGTRHSPGSIIRKDGSEYIVPADANRDIVDFEPIDFDQARSKYPGIQGGFHP